jgi:alpha/beta superfamily hydrolase
MMMQTPNRRSSCSFLWMGLAILAITCSAVGQEQPVFLWPDSELVLQGKPEHEAIRIYENGEHIVSGVHRPSVTPYIPSKDMATGAGVVIVPGGGHRELWMDHESYRVAEWLKEHGVAAFVLKYRLAREEGSTYTIEGTELADLKRAIRLVRSRAAEWSVDRGRVGVLGFSAGGELAAMASVRYDGGTPVTKDPIERESSKPDFQALLYPVIPSGMNLSKETPPRLSSLRRGRSARYLARNWEIVRGAKRSRCFSGAAHIRPHRTWFWHAFQQSACSFRLG